MAALSAKKKVPAVLNHYEVPETLPAENFKAKCEYCAKEITGSVRTTTNWWKHNYGKNTVLLLHLPILVSSFNRHDYTQLF